MSVLLWQFRRYIIDDIFKDMKLLIDVDDETAAQLERVAPGRDRRRSEFVRMAIRRALWEIEERATAEAYRRLPDTAADAYVDPATWESNSSSRLRPARRKVRR